MIIVKTNVKTQKVGHVILFSSDVELGWGKWTDQGLVNLKSFGKMRKISVCDTQLTDAGMTHLSKLARLEVVWLGKSRVTEEGMKALQAALPKVKFTETTRVAAASSKQRFLFLQPHFVIHQSLTAL